MYLPEEIADRDKKIIFCVEFCQIYKKGANMKTAVRTLCIISIVIMMATAVLAGQDYFITAASPENPSSAAPVACGTANAVNPIIVAEQSSPCPGGVYCNNPNTNCGEFCCEWGYFYSNGCTCKCYRSSYDAGANCSTYFRCQ